MKVSLAFASVCAVALNSSAFASVLDMTSVKEAIQKHQNKNLKVEEFAEPTCANFTGTWKGTCSDDKGKKEEETVVIKQYKCDSITFDDRDDYSFGGLKHEGDTTKTSTNGFSNTLDWNKDQTKANMAIHGGGRALGYAAFWEVSGNFTFSLVGENLHIRFGYQATSTVDGDVFKTGGSSYCQYTKQQ